MPGLEGRGFHLRLPSAGRLSRGLRGWLGWALVLSPGCGREDAPGAGTRRKRISAERGRWPRPGPAVLRTLVLLACSGHKMSE
ncbi:uncharacterized protein LOC144290632 isoform X2 [Canis aureus]